MVANYSNNIKQLLLISVSLIFIFALSAEADTFKNSKYSAVRGQDGRTYLCSPSAKVGVLSRGRFVAITQLIKRARRANGLNGAITKLWKRRLKTALTACRQTLLPSPSQTPTPHIVATSTSVPNPTITPTPSPTYAQRIEASWPEFHGSNVTIPFGVDYRLPTIEEFSETQTAINALSNPGRPRIYTSAARLAAIRATLLANSDAVMEDYYRRILLHTQYNLITSNWSIAACNTNDPEEMLSCARERLWNIEYLALVYRLDVDITPQFRSEVLSRAKAELASTANCGSYFQDNSTAHVAATA